MRFSVWPRPTGPYADTLQVARYADSSGWYGLWFADHYMGDSRDGSPTDDPTLEVWTVLPALAVATEHLRLGPLVSPTTFHHPALLAKRAATLDQISNGRAILGLGAGWQVNEHKAYGVDLRSARDRVDRFEEAIAIVRSLLSQPRTTVQGTHFQISDAPCEPKPVQQPLPILVGTAGPRMLRITARHAQAWNSWGTPETVARKAADLDRACADVGRDPSTIWRSAQPLLSIVDDPAQAAKLRERMAPDRALVGSTSELVDRFAGYAAAGIDEVIIPDFGFPGDVTARIEGLERFRTEVASHFAEA